MRARAHTHTCSDSLSLTHTHTPHPHTPTVSPVHMIAHFRHRQGRKVQPLCADPPTQSNP